MNSPEQFRKQLASVTELCKQGDHEAALAKVEAMLRTWPGHPHLYVLQARLIQLQESPHHTLGDAKLALQHAIDLEGAYPAAHIELGHFLDNVEDDPKAAAAAFATADKQARQLLLDALLGQAKALAQAKAKHGLARCVADILVLSALERFGQGAQITRALHLVNIEAKEPANGFMHADLAEDRVVMHLDLGITDPQTSAIKELLAMLTPLDAD